MTLQNNMLLQWRVVVDKNRWVDAALRNGKLLVELVNCKWPKAITMEGKHCLHTIFLHNLHIPTTLVADDILVNVKQFLTIIALCPSV